MLFTMVSFFSCFAYGQTLQERNPLQNDYVTVVKDVNYGKLTTEDSALVQEVFRYMSKVDQEVISRDPDRVAAGVLNILLGDIGVGHFYTGQIMRGVLDVLFCWTGIPGLIGIIEGIIWLCDDDDAWAERVAKWNGDY